MTTRFVKGKEKILIPITVHTFESILFYLLTIKYINRKFVRNVQRLLEIIDRKPYDHDDYQVFLLSAIEFSAGLRANGINNVLYIKDAVYQSDLDKKMVKDLFLTIDKNYETFSKEEFDHINMVIRDYVDYSYVYQVRSTIMTNYDSLMGANGKLTTKNIQDLKETLEDLLMHIRSADVSRESEESICLDPSVNKNLNTDISNLFDELTDPCNMLVTGLKELNRFLNGGYSRKRMYIYYAPTNSFKSGILLYNVLWICKFNPDIKPKYPNKHLAIFYVTMENTVQETLDRIHAIFTEGFIDVRDISKESYTNQWNDIILNTNTNFRIYIRYHAPQMTSMDLQGMVEELEEDENCEIVAISLDHLGNMGKSNKSDDDRSGLIKTAYELSDWIKRTDRTLITAMHTNSTFDDSLAEAIENGKTNLVRMMGRHCIADAKYIDRAVDQSIYIVKEFSQLDGQWYLGFKYQKVRSKKSRGSNIFYHKLENEITLRFDNGTQYTYSYPCIPGTENSMSMRQQESAQIGMQMGQNVQNPTQNDPFGAHVSVQSTPSKFTSRYPPVSMSINAPPPFEIGASPVYIEEADSVDFEELDFDRADTDMVQLLDGYNNEVELTENTVEEPDDEIFDDDFNDDELDRELQSQFNI